jgi:two-component system, sensor histidine kinase LadS
MAIFVRMVLGFFAAFSLHAQGALATQSALPLDSQRIIVLPQAPAVLDISRQFDLAIDPSGTQTFAQMQRADYKTLNGSFNISYQKQAAFWLRFTVQDADARKHEWWLEIEQPFLDHIEIFEPTTEGQFSHRSTGDHHHFATRDIPHSSFVFTLSPKATPTIYYVRVQGNGALWVKAQLWHHTLFAAQSTERAHLLGLAWGMLMLLIFVALLQGIVLKQAVYLAFGGYAAVTMVLIGSGSLALYMPPDWHMVNDKIPAVVTCLSVAMYAIFCHYFLYENRQSRVFRWLFYFLATVGLLGAVAISFSAFRGLLPLILLCKLAGSVLPTLVASRRLISGSWYDRIVWLGIFANIPAQTILLARVSGKIDEQSVWATLHVFNSIIVVHVLLLSFALFERMRRVNQERQQYYSELATEQLLNEAAHKIANDQRSFLAMVAHELRSPLAVARSAGYNLRQMLGAAAQPAVATRLDRVDHGLQQMGSLIEVCLSHERQGTAQPLSLQQNVPIADVNRNALGLMSDGVQERVLWGDLGDMASQQLPANTALLAIALRNLVENACRYDTSGAPVEVLWQREETHWRLSVLDRGPGIPADKLERLFEPFKRGAQDARASDGQGLEAEGLGLGLYIIKRIASMLNANVQVQARKGGGSVFYLQLPIAVNT